MEEFIERPSARRKVVKSPLIKALAGRPYLQKKESCFLDWICLSRETQKTCRGSSSFTHCAGENYKAEKQQLMRHEMRVFLGHCL